MLVMVLLADEANLLTVLPAELETLVRPCCALPATSDALSLAFAAPEDTASEVEEAARLCTITLDCRRASRGSIDVDMIAGRSGVGCGGRNGIR